MISKTFFRSGAEDASRARAGDVRARAGDVGGFIRMSGTRGGTENRLSEVFGYFSIYLP